MINVRNLINHLLNTRCSIDNVDSIIERLKISKNDLLQIIDDDQYKDYFQLLRPASNRNRATEKLALTLDLFCCTHYAIKCKNESCPFLHLCPYDIRPMHKKCTNKVCPYDHEVLKSVRNRKIIDARGLSFLSETILHELTRASADPLRSFWVCTDHGKKGGCSKKISCDRLHYCYFSLVDGCTKPHCSHVLNDDCMSYFRKKELNGQDHDDILNAFSKVLRQRKPDFTTKSNISNRSSSVSKSPISNDTARKSAVNQERSASSSSTRSKPSLSPTELASYDQILSSQQDSPLPVPEDDKDILLLGYYNKDEFAETETYLSREIECPIKLIVSKTILSASKEKISSNIRAKPIYYYCPIKSSTHIFQLLRWQHSEDQSIQPLIVYLNVHDAHDTTEQNVENNQFCMFRVHIFNDTIMNGKLLPGNRLQLSDPSTMCFDRMWIYEYNL